MERIEDFIRLNAGRHPHKTAVADGDREYCYAEFWRMVEERADELERTKEETVHVFRSSQSVDFLVEYFAAHLAGKIAAPLEKDTPEAAVSAIKENLAAFGAENGNCSPDTVADILFTTGTTGRSKGVMITHDAIIADAENLIEAQGYTPDLTFVISGPLNHIGSLSKLYPVFRLGGTVAVTAGMKDINALFRAMERANGKVATFLVPASIRMLMQFGEDKLMELAGKIDFIETGAAAITQEDMNRLRGILPQSRLFNTYASTETGIIATYNFNDGECLAGCLGKPMKHSGVKISGDGHILCTGRTLMRGYAGEDELTAEVLRDGTLYTSDLGMIDDLGRLRLTGRDGDVLNVGGYKVAPTEVENAAMASPQVADCVCVSAGHPVMGTVLKLLVVTESGLPLNKKSLALFLKERLEAYKVPVYYSEIEKVNRTYNGKIDRKSYKVSR